MTLSFNMAPGASLGNAVQAIEKSMREIGLPAGVQGSFQGTAKAFQASLENQPLLILAALITVYIVLGILYESYIHPLTILSTLPSAGVGALLALLLFKSELSMIALIGIILLIGIVKKNAIMMIDFALEAERNDSKRPEQAIYEACLLRFRPIMMTTMAALFGALAIGDWNGRGIGAAPAARHRYRRWIARQSVADALHDAGRLSLSGPHASALPANAGESIRSQATSSIVIHGILPHLSVPAFQHRSLIRY